MGMTLREPFQPDGVLSWERRILLALDGRRARLVYEVKDVHMRFSSKLKCVF